MKLCPVWHVPALDIVDVQSGTGHHVQRAIISLDKTSAALDITVVIVVANGHCSSQLRYN